MDIHPQPVITKDNVEIQIEQIKVKMENTVSDYDKEKLQERLAKLSGASASSA